MEFLRKCAKCSAPILVEAERQSKLSGKLLVCGGSRESASCWQRIDIVKKKGKVVQCIKGRRHLA